MQTKPIINWTGINLLKGIFLLRIQKNRGITQRLANPNNDRIEDE